MTCNEKIRETCNVEKMGCEGCAYYKKEDQEKPNKQKKEEIDE